MYIIHIQNWHHKPNPLPIRNDFKLFEYCHWPTHRIFKKKHSTGLVYQSATVCKLFPELPNITSSCLQRWPLKMQTTMSGNRSIKQKRPHFVVKRYLPTRCKQSKDDGVAFSFTYYTTEWVGNAVQLLRMSEWTQMCVCCMDVYGCVCFWIVKICRRTMMFWSDRAFGKHVPIIRYGLSSS